MTKLTHLTEKGDARMVDVSDKDETAREAVAEAVIRLAPEAFAAVVAGTAPKGDVLAAARIAGILAAKKTPELIPLCHAIPLAKAEVECAPEEDIHSIRITARVKTTAQTGVEMEALTAASIAALTLYDMTKALDKGAVIETVRLLTKSGGKSGDFAAEPAKPARRAVPQATRTRAKPSTLMGEVAAPPPKPATSQREAFRAFMTRNRLRATQWAQDANVPAAQIYSFLTGHTPRLPSEVAERLARAAGVRAEDMFR